MGVDLSPAQTAAARRYVDAAGLDNVTLLAGDISDIDVAALGPQATALAERFAGFVTVAPNRLTVRPEAIPLARIMASTLDGYLDAGGRFSRAS